MKRQHLFFAGIALLIAIVPQILVAQFSVSGKITDKETCKPLSGANIVVQNTKLSSAAATDGTYVITGMKQGTYSFKISFIGYKTVMQEVNVITGKTVDFALEYSPVMSDEVIVQSTRVQEKSP